MIRAALYFIGFVAITVSLIFLQPDGQTTGDAPAQTVTRNEPDLTALTPDFEEPEERRVVAEMVEVTEEPETVEVAAAVIAEPAPKPVTPRPRLSAEGEGGDMRALTWDTLARINAATGRTAPAGRPGSLLHTIVKRSVDDAGKGGNLERYVVKPGDSLVSIAQEVYGDANMTGPLYAANQSVLSGPNDLRAGQTLVLPRR